MQGLPQLKTHGNLDPHFGGEVTSCARVETPVTYHLQGCGIQAFVPAGPGQAHLPHTPVGHDEHIQQHRAGVPPPPGRSGVRGLRCVAVHGPGFPHPGRPGPGPTPQGAADAIVRGRGNDGRRGLGTSRFLGGRIGRPWWGLRRRFGVCRHRCYDRCGFLGRLYGPRVRLGRGGRGSRFRGAGRAGSGSGMRAGSCRTRGGTGAGTGAGAVTGGRYSRLSVTARGFGRVTGASLAQSGSIFSTSPWSARAKPAASTNRFTVTGPPLPEEKSGSDRKS